MNKAEKTMKKLFISLFIIIQILVLSSCLEERAEYTVTFVDGERQASGVFFSGDTLVYPDEPTRENYIFAGWSYDEDEISYAPLSLKVDGDITLYAVWEYDYRAVSETVYTDYIKINVAVTSTCYNQIFGTAVDQVMSRGSGVIFDSDSKYYYVLTNNHVTERVAGYSHAKYTVEDCYGNSYTATLLASSAAYDLAIMCFAKGECELKCAEFATADADVGDLIISLGQPSGVANALTFGEVRDIANVLADGSGLSDEIEFEVIWHDAYLNHGSSGGALLDDTLSLVGVNFAIVTNSDAEEFIYGMSVPLEKVIEFLNTYY